MTHGPANSYIRETVGELAAAQDATFSARPGCSNVEEEISTIFEKKKDDENQNFHILGMDNSFIGGTGCFNFIC